MDHTLDAQTLADRLKCEQKEYWMHLEAASSLEKYPAKQHARRVQEKLGTDNGLIYLPGEPARNNEDSDMPAPFRQRRYFYYLSGCNEQSCHLTYDIENDSLSLFIPRINPSRVIWNGRGSTPAEALEKYDIDQVFYIDQLQDYLQDWAKFHRGSLYILHQAQNPLISGAHEPVDSESLLPAINLARLVKDAHEIALIRKANDISSQAHREVLANIQKFKNEAQVEGLFLDVCVSKRAKQQAYDPIAASGPNAGTLHYDDNDQDFEDRQLMCLDAGCEWELYASDITRTFPLSGKWPSEEAKSIYQLVQRMQDTCIQELKPGVKYLDLHIKAHQIAIDGLLSLGILHNGTREEIYKAGTSKAFFPHGLGHHVGLEVHDPGQADLMSMTKGNPKYEMAPSIFPKDFHLPVYDPETCRSPVDVLSGHLEEGMVLTVEPGIYFSPYALSMFYLPSPVHSKYINLPVVTRYLPVGGVRIEDNLLITSKGYENLTTAPKGEAMLEIIRSQNVQWPFISHSSDLGPSVSTNDEVPLMRAPGFPHHTPDPALKPIVRASTAPVKRTRGPEVVDTVDFEPFDGPSLFSNFNLKRSSTTDDNVKRWREARERSMPKPHNTLCGANSPNHAHAYMALPSNDGQFNGVSPWPRSVGRKPVCKKCTILVEAVDRLRENLNNPEAIRRSDFESRPKVEPVAIKKVHEMKQRISSTTVSPVITSSIEPKPTTPRTSRQNVEKIPIWAKPADTAGIAELEAKMNTLECFDFDSFLYAGHDALVPTAPQTEGLALRPTQRRIKSQRACEHCRRNEVECVNFNADSPCMACESQSRNCVYLKKPANNNAITSLLTGTSSALSVQAAERNRQVCEHCRRNNTDCIRWSLSAPCTACVGVGLECNNADITLPLPKTSSLPAPLTQSSPPAHVSSFVATSAPPVPAAPITARPAVSAPRSTVQLACDTCRMRRSRCHRKSPTGPCLTCVRNGFICSPVSKATSLSNVAKARGCDTCHRRKNQCVFYSGSKDCGECEEAGLVCEDLMRDVILASSEEKRIELLREVDRVDGLVEEIEEEARMNGHYEELGGGTKIWSAYRARGITPYKKR